MPAAKAAPPTSPPISTPTGKVEVTLSPRPTETTKPTEAPKVPCQILPMEYCADGEKVTWQQANGKNFPFVGFNFPEGARVPVFAAVDGRLLLTKTNDQAFVGTEAIIKTTNGENYEIIGNIDTSQFGSRVDIPVKAGDIIGYTQKTTAKSLGSYDVVFTISQGGIANEAKLKELLPNAYNKPDRTFVSAADTRGGTGTMFQSPIPTRP